MEEVTILHQGPGFTIARSNLASTLVPYAPAVRENGDRNHGYIDLRARPDLVASVPEAKKSTGLATLLRAIADPASRLMSGGCECHAFENTDDPEHPEWSAGCYVSVMFQDSGRNKSAESLHDIAAYALSGIGPPPQGLHIGFEFLIEPLKSFFGESDCFCVEMKAVGHGATRDVAWEAMEYGLMALSASIARGRPTLAEPRL